MQIFSSLKQILRIGKIKEEEKLDFVKNLGLLIGSGITLNEGLQIIVDQLKPGAYQKFLVKAKKRIEGGGTLSSCLEENKYFSQTFTRFIKAGEESGTLTKNLNFLSQWLERNIALKKSIKSATLYPKLIIVFALAVGLGLSIFVLPQIVGVLEDLDVELPFTTRVLLAFSNFMENYGIYFAIFLIFLYIIFKILIKFRPIKKIFDFLFLKTPVVGPLLIDYQLAIISQLAFTLFQSGININHILEIVSQAVTNIRYEESMIEAKQGIEKGTNLSGAISEFPFLYPGVFVRLVIVGEKSGTLEESFSYLTDFFFDRVYNKVKALPIVLEPILLIIIGIFVAFFASAIILPIYEVTTGIS